MNQDQKNEITRAVLQMMTDAGIRECVIVVSTFMEPQSIIINHFALDAQSEYFRELKDRVMLTMQESNLFEKLKKGN